MRHTLPGFKGRVFGGIVIGDILIGDGKVYGGVDNLY